MQRFYQLLNYPHFSTKVLLPILFLGIFPFSNIQAIDLELSLSAQNPNVQIYQSTQFTLTVNNTGAESATNIQIAIPLIAGQAVQVGGSNVILSSGSFSGFFGQIWSIPSIGVGQSETLSIEVYFLAPPSLFAQVIAADQTDVDSTPGNGTCCTAAEDDEAVFPTSISQPMPLADLTLSNFSVESPSIIGYSTNFSVDLTNAGQATATGDFNITAFLSTDILLDNQDIILGTLSIGNTPVGGYPALSGSFTIPFSVSFGSYHLILKVDNDNIILESNENNNTIVTVLEAEQCICPFVDLPVCGSDGNTYSNSCFALCAGITDYTLGDCSLDLSLINLAVLSPVTTGFSTDFTVDIVNTNSVGINDNLTIGAYLSTDGQLDSLDVLVGTIIRSFTSSGTTPGVMGIVDIPNGTTPGTYQLILNIDDGNVITEADETNNIIVAALDVAPCVCPAIYDPVCGSDGNTYSSSCSAACAGITSFTPGECPLDLSLINLMVSSPVPAGFSTDFTVDIVNSNSTTISDSLTIGGYLSTDGQLDNLDVLVGTINRSTTSSGTTVGVMGTVNIPNGTTPGTYQLILNIDDGNVITEADETNNTISTTLEVQDGPCICPAIYDPVCGSDGYTYSSPCSAACAGITSFTPGECPPMAMGSDLELSIASLATGYFIYTNVLVTTTITNTGTETATGIIIDIPIPSGTANTFFTSSQGSFDLFLNAWNVGDLAPGASATFDWNLFMLNNSSFTIYGQVQAANPTDTDSTPGNGTCCTPNEDDEAVFTLSASAARANQPVLQANNSIGQEANVFPNPVRDQLQLEYYTDQAGFMVRLINSQGQYMKSLQFKGDVGTYSVDTAELLPGIYFLEIIDGGMRQQLRFVKL